MTMKLQIAFKFSPIAYLNIDKVNNCKKEKGFVWFEIVLTLILLINNLWLFDSKKAFWNMFVLLINFLFNDLMMTSILADKWWVSWIIVLFCWLYFQGLQDSPGLIKTHNHVATHVSSGENNVLGSSLVSGEIIEHFIESEVCNIGIGSSSDGSIHECCSGKSHADRGNLTY